jgi:quercetin dioxygenase-like cupin family protein
MAIIYHEQQPPKRGYYSKIINRKLVTKEVGAHTCEVWEQIIPPGGYIVPHSHDFEETITLLTGCAEVQMGEVMASVTAPATLFVSPHILHGITNPHNEPIQLLAFLVTQEAQLIYPEESVLMPGSRATG